MDPTGITDVQDAHDFDTPGGIPDPQTFTITAGQGGTGTADWYSLRSTPNRGSVTPSPFVLAGGLTVDRFRKGVSGSFAQILMNRSSSHAFSALVGRYPGFNVRVTVTAGSFTMNAADADGVGSGFIRWNLDAADTNIANSVSTGDTVTVRIAYE